MGRCGARPEEARGAAGEVDGAGGGALEMAGGVLVVKRSARLGRRLAGEDGSGNRAAMAAALLRLAGGGSAGDAGYGDRRG